ESGVGRPSTYAPTISTILSREYVVKEGKSLRPTPLGEVVTGLMKDRFGDIVDLKFTARMEELLDSVEKGEDNWQHVLEGFYGGFNKSLEDAETALEGTRIKVPDEVSDEICDACGRQMVIKSGRFGRFLACPGYPECSTTKPIVIEMPGRCPKCGLRILKRTSKNGYTYYACENLKVCGFMTWDVPVADDCPECGQTMFKPSGRGAKKPFCINEKCPNFLPEDKRGYKRKKETDSAAAEGSEPAGEATETTKKAPAKKTPAKKPAAKKTATKTAAAKKTSAKATASKTTKKTASKSKTTDDGDK
ncbi:MAG: DNA topoisomerase, partial [Oscillospiraceae bacterium]|nr:DNA topoisomerase [Oscillospiraceae bacterium]